MADEGFDALIERVARENYEAGLRDGYAKREADELNRDLKETLCEVEKAKAETP